MADTSQVPPLPPPGEIVSAQALYNTQISLYRNTLAFGGMRNPSVIWNSMLRDDGSAILYYRELEEKDVDVANALDTLKGTVLGRKWSIQPANEDDSQAAEVASWVKGQLAQVKNLDGVLDNLLDAPGYGFAVAELLLDTSMGQANLLDIKDCPQELFLFGDRFQPQIGPMQFLTQPQASSGQLVPEQKFLVWSYRARSRNRMGRPLLRTVFWPSWFNRNALRLWVQYCEKGPGTAVVRYQDADNPAEQAQAANLAMALIENVAVGVPANFEYDKELLTIARSMNPDAYEHLLKTMQLNIVRRILGETLTSFGSDSGKGTNALGNVHSDTLEVKSIGLCKALQSVLNWQLIRPLVLWNFGPDAPMPTWQYDVEEPEDLTARLAIDMALATQARLPMSQAYLYDRYDVPMPAAGDALVEVAPTAVGPAIGETVRESFSEASGPFAKGDLVECLIDHMPGMKGMKGKIAAVEDGYYYAVNFDKPMPGMKQPHKWLNQAELKGLDPSKGGGKTMRMAESPAKPDQAQADRDLHQFDRVMDELRGEAVDLYRTRVKEIADAVKP